MELDKIIKEQLYKVVKEQEQADNRYMFFQNLKQIERQCHYILSKVDESKVQEILNNGHDWADDHITEAKSLMDQVFDFIMNEVKGHHDENKPVDADMSQFSMNEAKEIDEAKHKPTNAKLWSRAKSMAKSKFKVYPSAYANGWAAKWYKSHGGGWRTVKK